VNQREEKEKNIRKMPSSPRRKGGSCEASRAGTGSKRSHIKERKKVAVSQKIHRLCKGTNEINHPLGREGNAWPELGAKLDQGEPRPSKVDEEGGV